MNRKEFKIELAKIEPKWEVNNNCIWCPEYMKPRDRFYTVNLLEDWYIRDTYFYSDILYQIKTRHTYPECKLETGEIIKFKKLND